MKKKFLYIGNKLSKHGNTATSIETLGGFFEEEGYTVYYASSKKNKILRLFDMLFTTIKVSSKVDYVLIDTYSTQNFWFAFFVSQLCRILNLKYIAKLHGGDLPNRLKKSPFLCDLIFKNAYKVTAPSHYLLDAFKEKYSKNLLYIPNTIELKNYEYFVRDFDVPKILWVRSFSKIYNPKMAIQVAADLKKDFPNVSLCMVGPDKENLINSCKELANKLNVAVTFTGKLSKEEWVTLSKNFNVFINTTHFDNTPISVIEAMALGLPVVSTNVGGIPFLLKDNKNAFLVNDNDSKAMVEAIKKIFSSTTNISNIIFNARRLIEDFDWNNVKKQWFEILK
jgi:glycosyltransferase involved in cell wall biosynthesis